MKENSNDIKENVPPIKYDVTDFCIDGTAIKSDTTKKEKQFKKKDQFKQKTMAESNTEREEQGIATEEKSEIVIPQPVFAHTHIPTRLETAHHGQTHPKSNHLNSQKNGEKGTTLVTGDSIIKDRMIE